MNDQARVLRGLMDRRGESNSPPWAGDARWPHAVVVTSGKGGVGTSVIALNLAIALAQQGQAVGLLDAAPGLGHVELLSGHSGYWNFQHVLSGSRTVRQICLDGPAGVIAIPGGAALFDPPHLNSLQNVPTQLTEIERSLDCLVIDAGTSITQGDVTRLAAADQALLVTTPEPTSVAATYALIKRASGWLTESSTALQVLVNRAETPEQAHETLFRIQKTSRVFLNWQPTSAGWLPEDEVVCLTVNHRQPFAIAAPDAAISEAIRDLACRVAQVGSQMGRSESYFGRLFQPAISAVA